MNDKSKHKRSFWLLFCPLFLASLLVPVLPLYMGPSGDVLMGVLAIWEVYVCAVGIPEWILVTLPVVITHLSLTYLTARRLSEARSRPIRFSLKSLLSATAVASFGVALVIAFAHFGFCLFFFACVMCVVVANYIDRDSVAGMPLPRLNSALLYFFTAVCAVFVLFGLTQLLAAIAV